MSNNIITSPNTNSNIVVKPKLGGWLFAYIFLSIPSFIMSWFILIVLFILIVGGFSAMKTIDQEKVDPEALQYEYLDGKKGSNNKILVYNMSGAILSGGNGVSISELQNNIYTDKIEADFKKIKEDDSVKAVVFKLDTPGGEVIASEVVGDSINDLMLNKKQSKAVFYWGNAVASGGVFLTTKVKNNYIVASPYGESGSIGVITRIPDLQGLYEKIGVRWRVYKSAPSKDYGSESRDPSEDENKFIQAQIDKTFNRFVDLVASGRNIERNKVLSFANGFMYTNDESRNLGLVDELGSLNQAYLKSASFEKLPENDYEVVTLKKKQDFWGELFGPTVKANLISNVLGVDTSTLNKPNLKGNMYLFDPKFVE